MAVEVVSLAIDATASVGMTFGVRRITRHVEGKFDVWWLQCSGKNQFAWVRAVVMRQGSVESRTLEVEDYLQHDVNSLCETFVTVYFAWYLQCFDTTHAFLCDLTIQQPPPLLPTLCHLVMWIHQAMYLDSLLSEHDMYYGVTECCHYTAGAFLPSR